MPFTELTTECTLWRRGCRKVVFQGSVWGTPARRSRTTRMREAADPLDRTLRGCHKHTAPRLDQRTTNTAESGEITCTWHPICMIDGFKSNHDTNLLGCMRGNRCNVPRTQTPRAVLEQKVTLTEDAIGGPLWYNAYLSLYNWVTLCIRLFIYLSICRVPLQQNDMLTPSNSIS